MENTAKTVEEIMRETSKAEIPLETRIEYIRKTISLLSGRVAKITEANMRYAKTVEEGFDIIGKKLKNQKIKDAIEEAQKEFIKKHRDIIRHMAASNITPDMQHEIIQRINTLERQGNTKKTRESEAVYYLFGLVIKIFENNSLIKEIIDKEIMPITEMGANYERLLEEKKSHKASIKEVSKLVSKSKIELHDLIKLVHIYKDREDQLNKLIKGKILYHEGHEIKIAGIDKEKLYIGEERKLMQIKIAEIPRIITIIIIDEKIRTLKPFGKITLGQMIEEDTDKIKALESWSKGTKQPKKYRITKHEQDMILKLKYDIKEKKEATEKRLKEQMKKKTVA